MSSSAETADLLADRASPRLYDTNFVWALLSQTCFVVSNTLLAHYARWIDFLDGDLSQIGWVMGAGAMSGLLLRPWMAQWINYLGAKRTWGLGYLLFSLSSVANLWIYDLGPAIFLIRATAVLGAALVFASSLTYIAQLAPESRRTEAIGILGVGGFFGMLAGPFLGDLFLGDLSIEGATRDRENFVLLFVVAAAVNVIPAILLFFLRPPPHQRAPRATRIRDFFQIVQRHWPGMILLVDLVFGVCMTVPFAFVASYIDETPLRMSGVSEIGFFFWCYAGIGIIVRVWLRQLPDRIGPKRVLVTGMWFMGIGMITFCAVSSDYPWLLCVPALLTGTGHSLMFHTMTSLTIQPFPTELRGTGSALALMMLDLGMFVGAPLLGIIAEVYGFNTMFIVIGGSCLISGATYYRYG